MTFWPLTNSDFPTDQTFHLFHDLYTELDLHRIMSGFHRAFAKGVASQQGTLTLPDTWFRPPFWDLLVLQLLRPDSSNSQCLYLTFHLEYPLVLSRFCLCVSSLFVQYLNIFQYVTQNSTFTRQNTLSIILVLITMQCIHLYREYMYVIRSFKWTAFNKLAQSVEQQTWDLRIVGSMLY